MDASSISEAPSSTVGEEMTQDLGSGKNSKGYVASYDIEETYVLKYYQDRSLYFNNTFDQTDA